MDQKGMSFKLIDKSAERTSSQVSSGLINPITGRYFARSWMIDTTLPFALKTYRDIESFTDTDLLRETKICRVLRSIAQENEWASKMLRPAYGKYMGFWNEELPFEIKGNDHRLVSISPVLQLKSNTLVRALKDVWRSNNKLIEEDFKFDDLNRSSDGSWRYKEEYYRGVIFCEGYQVLSNPYFQDIPIEPTKGEVIIARKEGHQSDAILKHHCFIIPWEGDLYWIGSNYEKFPDDDQINMKYQEDLELRLQRSVKDHFEIVERWTGIRPASKDRRPVLGEHPSHQGLYIFNGLGTKGTVYAPYFANQLVDHLISGNPIVDEASVNRWLL